MNYVHNSSHRGRFNDTANPLRTTQAVKNQNFLSAAKGDSRGKSTQFRSMSFEIQETS